VQEVLNYVRRHGQDSETLNLVYVVDEDGVLIDDIRMRKFLLADPELRVADLMDDRFTSLKATDDRNSGSQAATLVIRALALGEVTLQDWWRIMRREVFSGLALGSILGGIGFLRITIWSAFSDMYGPHWFLVALTVGVALIGIVMWGTLSGSMLPLVLRRAGFDPASSSAPFVATLVDVTGLVIYFSVAAVILRGALL
jgi:magnesium transporter